MAINAGNLNIALENLSLQHKLSEWEAQSAREEVQKICDYLKGSLPSKTGYRFSIDRTCIGGSLGKKTALEEADADVALFINGLKQDNTEDLFRAFEELLNYAPGIKKLTKIGYRFQLGTRSGLDIDLLPTFNFAGGSVFGLSKAENQAVAVWNLLEQNSNLPNVLLSAALYESKVDFMKAQSGFAHNVVRLCKLWNKKVVIPGNKISGRSLIIELVAVKAAREIESSGTEYPTNKMYYAFARFLGLMQNFRSINIDFQWRPRGWTTSRPLPVFGGPLVIQPANRFENLASPDKVNWTNVSIFEDAARISFRQLQNGVLPL